MNETQQREGVVDELLRERHEEAQRDAESHPGLAITAEEFRAQLKLRGELTLKRQAARRAEKAQAQPHQTEHAMEHARAA